MKFNPAATPARGRARRLVIIGLVILLAYLAGVLIGALLLFEWPGRTKSDPAATTLAILTICRSPACSSRVRESPGRGGNKSSIGPGTISLEAAEDIAGAFDRAIPARIHHSLNFS